MKPTTITNNLRGIKRRHMTNLRPILWALIAFALTSLYMAWDIGSLPDAPLSTDVQEER